MPPPMPHVTPISPTQDSHCSHDLALVLRKDRQAFYLKAASSARATVKMDTPKPALRPTIQPPGFFHLIPCGLLKCDLEYGEFQEFQDEVQKWQNDPACMDMLFAAFGRFSIPSHQVQPPLSIWSIFCTPYIYSVLVVEHVLRSVFRCHLMRISIFLSIMPHFCEGRRYRV